MIEAIELVGHKALAKCRLEGLGQINVICGKNNSGKSTLLEAIDSKENRSVGRRFDMAEVEEIVRASFQRTPEHPADSDVIQVFEAK